MFTIIKNWISSIFYLLKVLKLWKTSEENCFRILLYHCIGKPDNQDHLGIKLSLQDFLTQMRFLQSEGYNVFPLRELVHRVRVRGSIPPKSIAITFDDGYSENSTQILTILNQFGFTATFFITVNYIRRNITYSKNAYWQHWKFFSREELKNLLDSGNDIGSHSCSHRNLLALTFKEVEDEIIKSKNILQDMLNLNTDLFSYPHGKFNEKIKQVLKSCGYVAACTSIVGKNNLDTDPLSFKRISINASDGIFEFRKKIIGCYDWLSYIKR